MLAPIQILFLRSYIFISAEPFLTRPSEKYGMNLLFAGISELSAEDCGIMLHDKMSARKVWQVAVKLQFLLGLIRERSVQIIHYDYSGGACIGVVR